MKKTLCCIITVAMLVSQCFCTHAEEPEKFTCGEYRYVLWEDGTAEIVGYDGCTEELEIPAELDGYKVVRIGKYAFSLAWWLVGVKIPDGVTDIEELAFAECGNLTSITIPDSVTGIYAKTFESCEKLTALKLSPDHPVLAVIDGVLFDRTEQKLIWYSQAKKESSYEIPQGIQKIGDYAFSSCGSLTSITIPDSVTVLGECAFER